MIDDIKPHWKRIAGLSCLDDGTVGVVWLAYDTDEAVFRLRDTALFKNEVLAVICDAIANRGRWIPLAWEKKAEELAEGLEMRRVNILDPIKDDEFSASRSALEVQELVKTKRFKVPKEMGQWLAERKSYTWQDGKVPRNAYPLMTATRYAVKMAEFARAEQAYKSSQKALYPKVSIV